MPELPEVQTVVNDLKQSRLIGNTVTRVRVFYPRIIAEPTASQLQRQVTGSTIIGISRSIKKVKINSRFTVFLK
jgi:formamidopyrimidine-DNA glycosylase